MDFASIILEEKDFIKKIEMVAVFQKKEKVFFDTSVILKAFIAKQFIEIMKIDVDENEILTACLVYSFKRINSPAEISRIRAEGENDYKYLKSLGFSDRFCKICSEYNRYREKEEYVREKEGDILELVENFGGLILHRPERIAYPIDEAMEILEFKNLANKKNRYLEEFKKFIYIMEEIPICKLGSYTKFQREYNSVKRDDFSGAVVALYAHEERVAAKLGIETEEEILDNEKTVGKFTARLMELNKKDEEN